MKKLLFASAIFCALFAFSCGTETDTEAGSDSTAVAVDSSACCKDSASTVIPTDTNREDAGPKIDNPN
jgi:hypothetical protein